MLLLRHTVPDRPFYKVGADLLDCKGRVRSIVVTDDFSNYPEFTTLQSSTSKTENSFLKATVADMPNNGSMCSKANKLVSVLPLNFLAFVFFPLT